MATSPRLRQRCGSSCLEYRLHCNDLSFNCDPILVSTMRSEIIQVYTQSKQPLDQGDQMSMYKNPQNEAELIFLSKCIRNLCIGKKEPQSLAYFFNFPKKLPKVNNHQLDENSPNLVTLNSTNASAPPWNRNRIARAEIAPSVTEALARNKWTQLCFQNIFQLRFKILLPTLRLAYNH
jgi:hypothetical protein